MEINQLLSKLHKQYKIGKERQVNGYKPSGYMSGITDAIQIVEKETNFEYPIGKYYYKAEYVYNPVDGVSSWRVGGNYKVTQILIKEDNNTYYQLKNESETIYVDANKAKLFEVYEDALDYCDKKNNPIKTININQIKITSCFASTVPNPDKIKKRIEEYKNDKDFSNTIILNKEYFLMDGYTQYLVCKMFGERTVKCKIA